MWEFVNTLWVLLRVSWALNSLTQNSHEPTFTLLILGKAIKPRECLSLEIAKGPHGWYLKFLVSG